MDVYCPFFILFNWLFFGVFLSIWTGTGKNTTVLDQLWGLVIVLSNFTFHHKTQDQTNIVMLKGRKHLQVNEPPSKNIRLKQGVHRHCGGTGHVQAYLPNIPEGRNKTWNIEEWWRQLHVFVRRMQWRLQKGLGLYYDGYVTDILTFPQQFTRLDDCGKTIPTGNRFIIWEQIFISWVQISVYYCISML